MRLREKKLFDLIRTAIINDKAYFSAGISEAERSQLKEIFLNATPNPNSNEYPDYLTETGTIELFEITSSEEKQKGGAAQTREKKKYDRRVNEEQLEILRRPVESEDDFQKQYGWRFERPEHSHDNLIKSLKRNWNNHIDSLKKYSGNQDVIIFALGYMDMALSANDEDETINIQYRLSSDIDALKFINGNYERVDYVAFASPLYVEVIKTNVPVEQYQKCLCFKENDIGIATVMRRVRLGEMIESE